MAPSSSEQTRARIHATGLIAVIRDLTPDTVRPTVEALRRGGCDVIELTADTPNVMEMINEISTVVGEEASVGIGTVLDSETARSAQLAGADFIVTPSVQLDVIETANRYGTPVIVGAFTPTEAVHAYESGADLVKVFPASTGGPGHVAALRGPLGQIPLVPTGGVSLENVADFISAGATAVGVGSALINRDQIEAGEFDAVADRTAAFCDAIDQAQ